MWSHFLFWVADIGNTTGAADVEAEASENGQMPPSPKPLSVPDPICQEWVCLLRGINVGGKGKIAMLELRKLCEELGWRNVSTYIQSGNIVFSSTQADADEVRSLLEPRLLQNWQIKTTAILRTAEQWKQVIEENPMAQHARAAPSKMLVSFLSGSVSPMQMDSFQQDLQALAPGAEELALRGTALYIYFPMGMGTSKLNITKVEKLLGCTSTARNWNTVLKLNEMLSSLPRRG